MRRPSANAMRSSPAGCMSTAWWKYNFFIEEVIAARAAKSPKHPETLHYTSEEVFIVSGRWLACARLVFWPKNQVDSRPSCHWPNQARCMLIGERSRFFPV